MHMLEYSGFVFDNFSPVDETGPEFQGDGSKMINLTHGTRCRIG
jgi:hypothetical protein